MSESRTNAKTLLRAVDALDEAIDLCRALDLAIEGQGGENEGPLSRLLVTIEQRVQNARNMIDDVLPPPAST